MAEPTEERHQEPSAGGCGEDVVYRTKTIEFLGRSTPIVLQNDNGPCPLLAICNVLLLRNSLHIGADAPEVPLQKLLSLLAEKLIDSNSNVQDKDEVYVTNQQQNIADAIDLLPRLATGIDVNVQFRKVNDFEFTRECAIFDLLDIGLYHGWIVDPQDTDTLAAIESKSYNALVAELVDYETRRSEREDKSTIEEDCVDFVAATTAALGVPSPSLSRGRSFDDCPVVLPAEKLQGKGDKEEEAELIRALNLSKTVTPNSVNVSLSPDVNCGSSYMSTEEVAETKSSGPEPQVEPVVVQFADESGRSHQPDLIEPQECDASSDCKANGLDSESLSTEHDTTSASTAVETDIPVIKESEDSSSSRDSKDNERADARMQNQEPTCHTADGDGSNGSNSCDSLILSSGEDQSVTLPCNEDFSTLHSHNKPTDNLQNYNSPHVSGPNDANPLSTNEKEVLSVTSEVVNLGLEDREPIYEGEEHMLDSGLTVYENREPVYEGEMILAEQADKKENDARSRNSIHSIHPQGQLIKNFLESSASQLTIYGLFCLQDSLKERELCVFFRNNHFSTMFKFNGELYLLATDQGYINQPDLVWEKLNEVNGDTVFMTGNFTEFKAENPVNDSWSEQSAMTSTADYLATLEGSSPSRSAMNSDLQLAIALQQQEFEQQQQPQGPQRHQQQSSQQSSVNARSRLVTGPQAPRPSHAPQRSESKSKDKCTIM